MALQENIFRMLCLLLAFAAAVTAECPGADDACLSPSSAGKASTAGVAMLQAAKRDKERRQVDGAHASYSPESLSDESSPADDAVVLQRLRPNTLGNISSELALDSYSRALLVKTKNLPKLLTPSELANPWANALSCEEAFAAKCTCSNWGRWVNKGNMTPVACVRNTLATIYAIAKKTEELGFLVSLNGGTLLGSRRCGSFIPWDYDADMEIIVETEEQKRHVVTELNTWRGGVERPNSNWVTFSSPYIHDWEPRGISTIHGNVHIDLGVKVGGEKPSVSTVLNGIILHTTADFNEKLKHKYGADWKSTPKRWASWQTHQLKDAALQLDEQSMHACASRMTEIDAALDAAWKSAHP